MKYLDGARLDAVHAEGFRSRTPYPWVNPQGLLTERGYRELQDTLPDFTTASGSSG